MKTIIIAVSSLLSLITCQDKKETSLATAQTEAVANVDTNKIQQAMVVEYEASSRGYFSKITLSGNTVTVSNDRNNVEKPQILTVSATDLSTLTTLLNNLKPESLANLKGPTEKRFYDGAAHANLKITKDGTSFETQGFDAGFPPKEIEKLVNILVSFSEKQ